MKYIISFFLALVILVSHAFAQSPFASRKPLAPNVKFQGADNLLPADSTLYLQGTTSIPNTASVPTIVRKLNLGTPALASAASIVSSTNMKVGAYTVADTTPDGTIPRNITVTHTQVGGVTDTLGTITVVGTDANDAVISEVITPVSASTVAGTKAFKTVTSVTGAGWVINTGNDTLTVGYGNLVGLPVVLGANGATLTTLGTTVANSNTTGDGTISKSTVDASAGTFNGSKILTAYLDR